MARLGAYGRREWIRVEREVGSGRKSLREREAYFSDGTVLRNEEKADGSWSGWRVKGKWDYVLTPARRLRDDLIGQGWRIVSECGVPVKTDRKAG